MIKATFLFRQTQKNFNSEIGLIVSKMLQAAGFVVLSAGRAGVSISVDKTTLQFYLNQELTITKSGLVVNLSENDELFPYVSKLLIAPALNYY